jgi:uncharacterized membrane protein
MLLSVVPFVEARGAIPFAFGLGMNPFAALLFCTVSATAAIPAVLFAFVPAVALLKKIKPLNKIVSSIEEVINEKAKKYTEKEKEKRKPDEKADRYADNTEYQERVKESLKEETNEKASSYADNTEYKERVKESLKEKAKKYAGGLAFNKTKKRIKKKFDIPFQYKTLFLLAALPVPLTGIWTSSAVAAVLRLDKVYSFAAIALGNLVSSAVIAALLSFFSASIDLILSIFIGVTIAAAILTILKILKKNGKEKVF